MGSKKKTYKGVGYSKIYPPEQDKLNLFNKALVDTVASYKTNNPTVVGYELLKINEMTQKKPLIALKGAGEGNVHTLDIDTDKRELLLKDLDSKFSLLVDSKDSMLPIMYAKYHLTKIYGRSYLGVVPNIRTWKVNNKDVAIQNAIQVEDFESGIRSIEVDIATQNEAGQTYVDTLRFPYISSPITEVEYRYTGIQDKYNTFLTDAQDNYLTDSNDNYLTADTVYTEDPYRYEYILLEDYFYEKNRDLSFLSIVYKNNFIPNKDKRLRALNNKFGIPNSPINTDKECLQYSSYGVCKLESDPEVTEFQKVIDDSTTKHIVLAFAVEYKHPYKEIIDDLLGDNGYSVHLADNLNMRWIRSDNSNISDPLTGYCMEFEDYNMELFKDGEPTDLKVQYMIPLEWLNKNRMLVEKYDDLKESLSLFVYSQKTVKIKWYQTGIFKWILGGLGLLVFLFTGNPTLLLGVLTSVVLSELNLNPMIQAVIGVIIGVISGGLNSLVLSTKNLFATVMKVVMSLSNYYFKIQVEDIGKKVDEYDNEIDDTEKLIAEFKKQGIYIPLDTIQNYYDSMYTMQYDIYDSAYEYDKIYFNTNILENYSIQGTTDE